MEQPDVVVFDVNETLFSLDALKRQFSDMGLTEESVDLWFAHTMRDGFALSLTNAYRSFNEVAMSDLELLLNRQGVEPTQERVNSIISGFSELDPFPDALPAMETLRDADVRILTLTVGSSENTHKLLKRANLDRFVERAFSCDEARHWKPHPAPYRLILDALGLRRDRVALVSAHGWDILGANRTGLVTGWCSRMPGRFPSVLGEPDVSGDTLTEVVDGLLALPMERPAAA